TQIAIIILDFSSLTLGITRVTRIFVHVVPVKPQHNHGLDSKSVMAMLHVTVAVLYLLCQAHGYPNGLYVDTACNSMTPGHGVFTQYTDAPYYVHVYTPYFTPGQNVTVSIWSYSNRFKGFMIQARRANASYYDTEAIGTFTPVYNTTTACSSQALVHNSAVDKTDLTFQWTAPVYSPGDIKFRVTFVESKNVFWTDVESVTVYDGSRNWTIPSSTTATEAVYSTTYPVVLYKDSSCGSYRGCFSSCNMYGCDFLVMWVTNYNNVTFTLKSSYPAPGFYLALGFSNDNEMGNDYVIGCAYQNGQVFKFVGQNEGDEGPTLYEDDSVVLTTGYYINGILTCEITRPIISGAEKRYDLNNYWTLLFAKGVANIVNNRVHLYYHESDKHISSRPVTIHSSLSLDPLPGMDYGDNVNADSANTLMQVGYFKIILTIMSLFCLLVINN
ncbi:DOMON domain-containing protein frrs1L, partial [Bulinus truncatus]